MDEKDTKNNQKNMKSDQKNSKKDRKKFNFMKSFYEAVETLPKKDRQKMYEAIIKYSFEDDYVPEFKGGLKTAWILIQPILDASFKQYKNGSQNTPRE